MIPDFPGLGPIDWKTAASSDVTAASSATHQQPTTDEMIEHAKKMMAAMPLMLPKSLLEIPVDFNSCNYASAMAASELFLAHIKQDILSLYCVPSSFLFPLFDAPLPPEPPPRRQLAHEDTHLFARPDTKTRGQQFDEQEILRTVGKNRCQFAWSEVLQAHVRVGGPL